MMRVMKCAICPELIVPDFEHKFEDAVCLWRGKSFRYRLYGSSISEIFLMDFTSDEAEMCDGTGL